MPNLVVWGVCKMLLRSQGSCWEQQQGSLGESKGSSGSVAPQLPRLLSGPPRRLAGALNSSPSSAHITLLCTPAICCRLLRDGHTFHQRGRSFVVRAQYFQFLHGGVFLCLSQIPKFSPRLLSGLIYHLIYTVELPQLLEEGAVIWLFMKLLSSFLRNDLNYLT